jgi:ribosomal protein L22
MTDPITFYQREEITERRLQMTSVVPRDAPHTPTVRGDANMTKQLNFPKEIEDFIHELIANAIIRAEKNGLEVPKMILNEGDEEV